MKRLLIHILIWIVFFFIWKQIAYFYVGSLSSQLRFTAFDCLTIMLPFYIVYFFIVPFLVGKKNKLVSVFLFLVVLVVMGWVMIQIMKLGVALGLIRLNMVFVWDYSELVFNRYFIVFIAGVTAVLAKITTDWLKNKKRIEQLEKENKQAELSLLKAQLNPHFLFNSLNGIYVQLDIENSPAKKSLHNFSNLLRYQLYECNAEKVLLVKESNYLKNFIELQKTRKENNVRIEFNEELNNEQLLIAPLLLIVFVENAFKHVSAYGDGKDYIDICLKVRDSGLLFSVKNSKDQVNRSIVEEGIGLQNVRRRLHLLYPGRHSLSITDADPFFEIVLNILL